MKIGLETKQSGSAPMLNENESNLFANLAADHTILVFLFFTTFLFLFFTPSLYSFHNFMSIVKNKQLILSAFKDDTREKHNFLDGIHTSGSIEH